MAKERPLLFALNAGEISPLALGRVDLERMRITAETYLNCFPRIIGPLIFRPGFGFLSSTLSDAIGRNIPFIFSATDTALIELTNTMLRIRIADALLTRPTVATVVTNGDFSSGAGWTLTTTGGATATISGGVLTLDTLPRGSTTLAKRSVTVAAPDQNVVHALRIVVTRGPVRFRCGSTDGGDEYIAEAEYGTGTHSLTFTPTGASFFVQFSVESQADRIVDSITVEVGGTFTLPTPWLAADLWLLRFEQSGDVIFVTEDSYQPRRIERRHNTTSWSIVNYEFVNGPYRGKTADVQLTPSVRVGNGTMTSSAPFFKSTHVGCLFRLFHPQTDRDGTILVGEDRYTTPIRVTGVKRYDVDGTSTTVNTDERDVIIAWSGTWVGTVSLLTSEEEDGNYRVLQDFTNNQSFTRTPGQDNEITFFKIGFLPGDYTSGTLTVTNCHYTGGGGFGVVRVTGFNSTTSVNIEVVSELHDIQDTTEWEEGKFSDVTSWPSSVSLFEARLVFGSRDKISLSFTDDFTDFDVDTEGDAAAIVRSIATGPVNKIHWFLPLARLCMGTSGAEPIARSTTFDEPLTAANFNIKDASTQGSADVQALKVDRSGVFVQRSGSRAYVLKYSLENQDYISEELTRYHPDILAGTAKTSSVKVMAVQRQPDTRIWFVLNDGTAVVLTYEPLEEVIAFCRVTTDGLIEDVCTLPNTTADDVYFVVQRTINAVTKRYVEKLAYDTQAQGGTDNRIADSYVTFAAGGGTTTITGLTHLEAKNVVVWANGSPLLTAAGEPQTFTVVAGQITVPTVTNTCFIGLAYTGQWKSTKLAYGAQGGTALFQRKKLTSLGLLLYKTHLRAIKFGHDFVTMDLLSRMQQETDVGFNHFFDQYDDDGVPIPGDWSTDARLCLEFRAPLPATVLAVAVGVETHERG